MIHHLKTLFTVVVPFIYYILEVTNLFLPLKIQLEIRFLERLILLLFVEISHPHPFSPFLAWFKNIIYGNKYFFLTHVNINQCNQKYQFYLTAQLTYICTHMLCMSLPEIYNHCFCIPLQIFTCTFSPLCQMYFSGEDYIFLMMIFNSSYKILCRMENLKYIVKICRNFV